ncbi:MAG: carbamate kinase [Bacteroidales bacterium]|jgi:carbamate kinase|nr:carbamate kinase [Bacteroidales bacterium]
MDTKLAVIAFGGNAISRAGQKGTIKEQIANVTETCGMLLPLLKRGYQLVIGHGNGPQVGNVMLQHEAGRKMFGLVQQPLDFCVSETQGSIGYLIEIGLRNLLKKENIQRDVVTLVTPVVVDQNDPMFANPTKPIGPYYSDNEVEELLQEGEALYKADPKGNGWRKVVVSPKPLRVGNIQLIEQLARTNYIVIAVGGGGIPVVENPDGQLHGIEAVIDKDLASALTAVEIGADEFYILTDVPHVYVHYNTPKQQALHTVTVSELKRYLSEGHFTEGSMAPKVRAAIYFTEHGGKKCIITEARALSGKETGTQIIKD